MNLFTRITAQEVTVPVIFAVQHRAACRAFLDEGNPSAVDARSPAELQRMADGQAQRFGFKCEWIAFMDREPGAGEAGPVIPVAPFKWRVSARRDGPCAIEPPTSFPQ